MRLRSWLPLVLVLLAAPALAGDGRLEIHQACVATGCFAGDAPGFPVETQAGQSYVLTSSLTVFESNTVGVFLRQRAVLDLNGFEIAGPTICMGTPANCAAPGTGDAIYAEAHATIRNGTLRGAGRHGIAGEVGVTVENVLVQGSAGNGIFLNFGSDGPEAHLIRGVRVVRNGGTGILNSGGSGGIGSLITDCVVHGNALIGLSLSRTQLTNCAIGRNGGVGLSGSEVAFGQNTLTFNNGGNNQAQTSGSLVQIGINVCGTGTNCLP